MKFLTSALILTIFGAAFAAKTKSESLRTTSRTVDELREMIAAAGGCNVNVCFALDGSGSVTSNQFNRQINFVIDVINVIAGNPFEAAAVQYGLINRPISFLTPDVASFITSVADTTFAGDSRTSVGGGIVWCHGQLSEVVKDEAAKIVVIGDGRNNLGGSPAFRAKRFRNDGGEVCVVGIGFFRARRRLLRIAGGNRDFVLTVRDYLELRDILDTLVSNICGIPLN